MKNRKTIIGIVTISIIMIFLFSNCTDSKNDKMLAEIKKQLVKKIETYGDNFPEYTVDGNWLLVDKINWFA